LRRSIRPILTRIYTLTAVLRRLALLAALLVCVGTAQSATASSPPPIRAHAAIVADGQSGEILFAKDPDRRLPMASITKLMTALLTVESTKPEDVVTIRGPAPSIGESTINLVAGERITVRDLLAAALVQSANDAAYALATYVGGSVPRFIRMMNERARELGLDNTHYVVPDGLDTPRHFSSVRDTLVLAREAMKSRLFRRTVARRGGRIAGDRSLYSWNDLLRSYPGAIGVKTGHTGRAGWSEIAAAERDGVTMYAVLFGGPTRAKRNHDLSALLDWAFDHYGRVQLIAGGRTYASADVPFSDRRVPLVADKGAEKVIRLGRPLVQRIISPDTLELPVRRGQRVGVIRIYDGDRLVAHRPLIASVGVDDPSVPTRARWYAGRALDEAGDMLSSLSPF
jgi:D-alanyl-D-alanine carboxypeptidase (penicillin-binding protein 5/6)